MPSLIATISADSGPFRREMVTVIAASSDAARAIEKDFQKKRQSSGSSIFNAREEISQIEAYGEFWKQSLLDRDILEATRSNKARSLWRARQAEQVADLKKTAQAEVDIAVDTATRSNKARSLWRARQAEQVADLKKTAQAEVDIAVDTATRVNKARSLLRARAMSRLQAAVTNEEALGTSASTAARVAAQMRLASLTSASAAERAAAGFKGLGGSLMVSSLAMREFLVLIREIGRGNWTRVPGSLSILIQSLGALKYVLNPITAGIALVAGAVAIATLHFQRMDDAIRNVNTDGEQLRGSVDGVSAALQSASNKAAEFHDWLVKIQKAINDPQVGLAKQNEDELADMRKKFERQRRRAASQGQSPADANTDLVREDELEEQLIQRQIADAKFIAEQWTKVAKEKEKASEALTKDTTVKGLEAAQEKNQKILTAITEEATKTNPGEMTPGAETMYGADHVKSVKDQTRTVKVGNEEFTTSVTAAAKEVARTADRIAKANADRKEADEALKRAQEKADAAAKEVARLTEASKVAKDKSQEDFEAGEEPAKNKKALLRGSVNSLQAVGAYAMPGQVELIDVAKKSERHLAKLVAHAGRGGQTPHSNRHARF